MYRGVPIDSIPTWQRFLDLLQQSFGSCVAPAAPGWWQQRPPGPGGEGWPEGVVHRSFLWRSHAPRRSAGSHGRPPPASRRDNSNSGSAVQHRAAVTAAAVSMQEQPCEACGRPDGEQILCDCCLRCWHLDHLEPPLAAVPEGTWLCSGCNAAGHRDAVEEALSFHGRWMLSRFPRISR